MEVAKAHDLPITWFKLEDQNTEEYAVVVDREHVFRQKTMLQSFIFYYTSFSAFNVSWTEVTKTKV